MSSVVIYLLRFKEAKLKLAMGSSLDQPLIKVVFNREKEAWVFVFLGLVVQNAIKEV